MSETKTTEPVIEVQSLTHDDIITRHKERVDALMAKHGFETTEQLWEVPDELRAIHLALAEDYRAHAGWTKPNPKVLSTSIEEEPDDVAETEEEEPAETAENGA